MCDKDVQNNFDSSLRHGVLHNPSQDSDIEGVSTLESYCLMYIVTY